MSKMLSMCGLDCAACPALIAYRTHDQALRISTAQEWSKQFGVQIEPEAVNCVGCLQIEGPHIGHCGECEVRQCGLRRNVENCALCDDYSCETLDKFLAQVPAAKANLEEVRRDRRM